MPFGPVDPNLDLVALEERVLARWRATEVVEETKRLRKGAEPWIFYEGPPTANGRPGLHHVWARVFKDLYPRFQTMRGHDVPRKGGWDCHGLPVEIEVEKELGLTNKHEIEAYGVAEFTQRCRDSVSRYVEDWAALTERSGVWIDTKDAYWTLSNDYIESVWWIIRQMWDKGLVYEGHRVTPYCPRCGTALASHEVAQGYQDVVDPSAYVRFPISAGGPTDADLLVWTTTPWTLVSNVAVVAGPDITYVRLRGAAPGRDVVIAADAAERHFGEGVGDVVSRFTGRDLVGWRYQRPFTDLPIDDTGGRVVVADYVTTTDGTGLVHTAPAFGEDDANTGRAEGLPVLNPVDADGAFDHTVPRLTGVFVKDADRMLLDDLAARGLLEREVPYEHSYPHCWRCGTPLIYWAKTSWFVRTSEQRAAMVRENEKVGWHPEHIKHGRFGNWLETNVDWALSRDRYWGTPWPVWRCADRHDTCVGSVAELSTLAGRDLTGLDLHRPYVDDVTFGCPVDGCHKTARRLLPVIDTWFDSGSMPSAQHHYPFADREQFESAFPADFICEAIDQTRGWFYSLLAVNTLVFDSTPFKNVVCLGLLVDEDGQKMSKSRGNVIDPWMMCNTHGADALRWNFLSAGQPWTTRRVSDDGIRETTRKTLLTLWNVFSFFATYADLDGWTPAAADDPAPTHFLDRWVLSELADTVGVVTEALDGFDALTAATRLATFVDDLSNWYVRRSRPRFWKSSDPRAHATLYRCLVTSAQLLAPLCPFLSDEIYVALTGELSVHTSDWPTAGAHDPALAGEMQAVRRLVTVGRAARAEAKVKVRQPLRRALLLHPGAELTADARAEIADELNVKALDDIDSLSGLVSWTVVPNFRALGPRLGPKVNDVKAALATADGGALQAVLERDGAVEVAGERLTADEVEVRADRHQDFALAQDGAWAVALDLELDDALRSEGTARELVRAINDLRKSIGLELSDRISLTVDGPAVVVDAASEHQAWIAGEVLATSFTVADIGAADDAVHALDIDGATVWTRIEKA
ncbi:MAG TPA: isoleucine--tRNA ligase [Acidimicrobiales bacterium]|nr:isoleucine--tRNA ligase [Acidimicrobiales bacterium]